MALLKPSVEQVYDLIALTNAASWPQTAVALTYGAPAALTAHVSGKDTSLAVSAAANTPYVGTVTVFYNRLPLSGFETNYGEADLIVGDAPSVADVIGQFNAFYDASLTTDDYEPNAVIPRVDYTEEYFPDYDGEFYVIVAKETSLAYSGSAAVKIRLETAQLSSILTVSTLDGLTFPEA